MFQQTISEKINNINLLKKEDLKLFFELKNKYPYAEIFQLINLLLVKKFDALSFEEELSNAAYKIRDRNKLEELINTPTEQTLEEENPKLEIEEAIKVSDINTEKDIQSIEEKSAVYNDEIIVEIDQEKINLETQIAAEAFSTIFSKDFEPTIQFQIEDDITIDSKEDNITNDKKELINFNTEQSYKSFTDWLKSGKKVEKTDKNQIIDTIINTNPSITRPKKEFYNPSKQAIRSVEDEQLVYTETLAKILEMQGNFSKAISAYTQLSLTIPEKKTYFAKKIKDLNEKLNSK